MTRKTHLTIATIIIIPFLPSIGLKGLLGIIGAAVPDWDRIYPGGHRKFTHSILALILFSALIFIFDTGVGFTFALAYISHLLLDAVTKAGVPFFYPIIKKRYGLKLIRTGSAEEYLLLILAISGFLLTF